MNAFLYSWKNFTIQYSCSAVMVFCFSLPNASIWCWTRQYRWLLLVFDFQLEQTPWDFGRRKRDSSSRMLTHPFYALPSATPQPWAPCKINYPKFIRKREYFPRVVSGESMPPLTPARFKSLAFKREFVTDGGMEEGWWMFSSSYKCTCAR